jgi:hypothetical protein
LFINEHPVKQDAIFRSSESMEVMESDGWEKEPQERKHD